MLFDLLNNNLDLSLNGEDPQLAFICMDFKPTLSCEAVPVDFCETLLRQMWRASGVTSGQHSHTEHTLHSIQLYKQTQH